METLLHDRLPETRLRMCHPRIIRRAGQQDFPPTEAYAIPRKRAIFNPAPRRAR
jgi:hypothetical protein